MAENTEISWTDATFNPWLGCTKVSPGCDHCYAETLDANRFSRTLGPVVDGARERVVHWGAGAPRHRTAASNWRKPLTWNDEPFFECLLCGFRGTAQGMGDVPKDCKHLSAVPARRRVFCASLADVFDNEVDPHWRVDLLDLIRRCENLDFLLLTKRVGNVTPMLREVAALLWSGYGPQAERAAGVPAGPSRGTGDRRRWPSLAGNEADVRPLERWDEGDALQASARRAEDPGGILAGAGDDRRQEALRGGSTTGLAPLEGADPAGADGESRGRHQGPQSPAEPGAGDLQRAADSRGPGAGGAARGREGIEAPEGAGNGNRCGFDAAATGGGMASEGHSGAVRDNAEVRVAHLHREDLAARRQLLGWIERWLSGAPPANVWLGATIVNQEEADRDIPKLLATPARVRFLSMEPLLGPVNLGAIARFGSEHGSKWTFSCLHTSLVSSGRIDWVIAGGESGHGARPMNPQWARDLRDQCAAAGVPFHFKQNGEFASVSAVEGAGAHHTFPDSRTVRRVGKAKAGRLLDGVEHNGFPRP